MQFSQLYGAQLDIELGTSDTTQLFTTARRKKAINDAMHNFERTTSCTARLGQIPIVTGTGEYNLMSAFPDYFSLEDRREPKIKRVNGSSVTWIEGENFVRRTPTQLDREDPGWMADPNGTPTAWYLRDDAGSTFIGLDPPPDKGTETWTLYVPYLATSTDMSADSDIPFTLNAVPSLRLAVYHQALVHYAAGVLEPLRKNYSGANRQMGLYAGFIAQYETEKRKKGPSQVTMRRNYLRDATRPSRPVDPHRFP